MYKILRYCVACVIRLYELKDNVGLDNSRKNGRKQVYVALTCSDKTCDSAVRKIDQVKSCQITRGR